jgi:uncharacterized membrane protein YfcA
MDSLDALSYLLILVGGLIAGGINALAGYGSIITLTLLIDVVGLSPVIANSTNRIGVLANSLGSTYGFYKGGKLEVSKSGFILATTLVGALAGTIAAIYVSNEAFKVVFKYLIIVLLLTIVIKPKRWLNPDQSLSNVSRWLSGPIYVAIGFYGGFIQMGMGLVFLAATVLLSRIPLINANALKVSVVALYTVISVALFQYHGMLRWQPGLLLGVGQLIGGYATAKYASKTSDADKYAYWLLVVIVLGICVKTFAGG